MTIDVREARPEEFPAIAELTVAAYAALPGMGPLGAYGEELADIAGRGPSAVVLVAVDIADIADIADDADDASGAGTGRRSGQVLGDVTYYRRYADEMPKLTDTLGELAGFRMLATDPAAQGRGVGAALTMACVQRARADGAPGIALHTTNLMQAAQRLYQRLGFERWTALDVSFGRTRPVQVLGYRMLFEDTDSESA